MAEKILIVDDDVETLRLVGLMLQRQGYEILAASNGTQAISMAKNDLPDLIVLDVMMPDMDGYQVTHELRRMPETALVPILMFTAKSQVDDKVAGYDAGVDDYLTKPVHPAELVAHIKALLSRTHARPAAVPETPAEKSYMIGSIACRGGLGVSTLTLNLANCYAQANKGKPVIAVELRPGQGTWGFELGFNNPEGLNSLFKHKPSEITPDLVSKALVTTGFGIKLLLASSYASNLDFATFSDILVSIMGALARMNAIIFVDIGTNYLPGFEKICKYIDNFIVLTEPQLITVKRTKVLMSQLEASNLTSGKALDLILYNRVRADIQMSSTQVSEEMDGMPVSILIPPSPELANQASQRHLPMVNLQPDGLVAQQFGRLAEILHDRVDQAK